MSKSGWYAHAMPVTVLFAVALAMVACGTAEPTTTQIAPSTSSPTRPPSTTPTAIVNAPFTIVPTATRPAPTATAGPNASPTPSPVKPKAGGVLRTYETRNLEGNDFHFVRNSSTWVAMAPLMSWLVAYNEGEGRLYPDIAESWDISADGLTYTFHLAKGATWHDGQPVTADDVLYNVDRISGKLDLKDPVYKTTFNPLDTVEKVDASTVRMKLKQQSAPFLSSLGIIGNMFYPKHVPIDEFKLNRPVGSGPYKWQSYQPDIQIILKRNSIYWKKDDLGNQLPYLDGVTIFIIPDATAARAAFRTAQLDVTFPHASPIVGVRDQVLKDVPGTKIITSYSARGLQFRNKPPFDDIRFRKAVHLALDRTAMANIYDPGESEPFILYSLPGSKWGLTKDEVKRLPGYNPDTKAQDIDEAKKLFADFLKDHNLTTATFRPVLTARDIYKDFAVMAQDILKRNLGLQLELKVTDSPTTVQLQQAGNFDLYQQGTAPASSDPSQYLTPFFYSTSGLNLTGMGDPEIDKSLDEMDRTLDVQKRNDIARSSERKILDTYWVLITIGDPQHIAVRPEVRNFNRLLSQDNNSSQFERVWLDK